MDVFQICDYAPLETMTDAELEAVRATAEPGMSLELGTRGIRPEHLPSYLRIAGILVRRFADHVQRPGPHPGRGRGRGDAATGGPAGVRGGPG